MADRYADHRGLGRLRRRVLRHHREAQDQHIYVANWFFGAFIITVAVLHIVNSLAMPVSLTKSYSLYAGVRTPWCSGGTATTRWASS